MRTVLQIIPRLESGGAEETTLEIVEALVRNGDRALVASQGGRLLPALLARGGEHFALPLASKNPWTIWRNIGRLRDLIGRERVDLLHVRSRAPAFSALGAARRAGIPMVATYHGAYSARNPLKRAYNSVMTKGDAVIANSNFVRDHVVAEHGLSPDRVITIPRGVDEARFRSEAISPERRQEMARTLDWARDFPVKIAFAARVTRFKGHLLALEALSRLPDDQRRQIAIAMAGFAPKGDPFPAEIEAFARARNLAHHIKLIGPVSDIPALYNWADAGIAPTIYPEAFGRAAIEAQAMGRPVIAAGHGGTLETVRDGETGLWFAPGDVEDLARKLGTLLSLGPEGRRKMGEAGAIWTRSRFTLENLQVMTLRVYDNVLKTGRRPGADQDSTHGRQFFGQFR